MDKGAMFYSDHQDGGITLGYEDMDVECFGGMDYEATYMLDPENADKLRAILSESHSGSLKEMIIEAFGLYLDKVALSSWFKEHDIEYNLNIWIS